MNKRTIIITVFALVIFGVGLVFTRSRVEKPPALSSEVRRASEQTSAVPAVVTMGGKKETRPREGGAHPFCAPGSTLYLTQAQQEYKLGERGPNTPAVKDAKRNGALAKVTLRVVDSRGNPVPDADVKVAFFHRGPYSVDGKTDKNGFFTAKHMSESDVHFHASKEGYYRTYRNYWFYREGKPCAENGRWVPWNPTLEVVMKEKRNPIDLISVQNIKVLLPKGIRVGFDCKKRALVDPHGSGTVADFFLTYTSKGNDRSNLKKDLVLSFDEGCGAIILQKDLYSQFVSLHEAPASGYTREFSFSFRRTPTVIEVDTSLSADNYIIMKSRCVTDESGKILESLYSKFYRFVFDESRDGETGYMLLQYRYNPTNNDRNLEGKEIYP